MIAEREDLQDISAERGDSELSVYHWLVILY